MALRGQEGIGHGAANHQHIHLAAKIAQQFKLGRNLGAAHNRHHRPRRIAQRRIKRLQFRFHQPPGIGRQQPRHTFRAGMGTMGGGERIIHKGIAELGECCCHGGVILFLAGMEARILQKQYATIGQRRHSRFRRFTDAIITPGNRAVQRGGQRFLHGL